MPQLKGAGLGSCPDQRFCSLPGSVNPGQVRCWLLPGSLSLEARRKKAGQYQPGEAAASMLPRARPSGRWKQKLISAEWTEALGLQSLSRTRDLLNAALVLPRRKRAWKAPAQGSQDRRRSHWQNAARFGRVIGSVEASHLRGEIMTPVLPGNCLAISSVPWADWSPSGFFRAGDWALHLPLARDMPLD